MKYTVLALIIALSMTTATYAESGSGRGSLGIGVRSESEIEVERDTVNIKARGGANVSIDQLRTRAVAEIDRRVESLNKLERRIDAMVKVSTASKASIKATVDAQIKLLTDLKSTIQNATDEASLKASMASITKAYRVYMLVMPQLQILAAADRVTTTTELMTVFTQKLDTRISEAKSAGKDVSALEAASLDMKTQITEAKANASAAITLSANLKPDNGDKTLMESNKKALMDARAKLKAAHEDLKSARKDAETIVKGLKGFGVKVEGKVKVEDR